MGLNDELNKLFQTASEVSQNKDVFLDGKEVDVMTGDYESSRLDPTREFSGDVREQFNRAKTEGPMRSLLEGEASRIFSYPLDLGSKHNTAEDDVNHFMQFNMYEVESPTIRQQTRLSTVLKDLGPEETESLTDKLSAQDLLDMGIAPNSYELASARFSEDGVRRNTAGYSMAGVGPMGVPILIPIQRKSGETIVNNIGDSLKEQRESERKVRSPNPTRTLRQKKYKSKDTCFLYMPHKINNLSLQSYDTPSLLFGALATQAGTDIAQAVNAIKESGDFEKAGGKLMEMFGAASPIILRKLVGMADSVASIIGIDTELEATATQLLGQTINPRKEMVYNSPELRTFEFTYEFYPRNANEAKMVRNIIKLFRFHAAPMLQSGGNFLVPPSIFTLKFYKRSGADVVENPFLLKMRDCALTEVNVDFTPNGNFTAFGDGSPVSTTMSLTFKEVDINVKDDILEGY